MPSLPRLAPNMLRRPRLDEWFERHADAPLRLLVASGGTGKTTALILHLAASQRRFVYLCLRDDETPESLRERLSSALELEYVSASLPAMLAAIATRAPFEIAIDDADRGTPETVEELLAMAEEAPEGVGFIYAGRSRARLDAARALAHGLAVLLDDAQLAFTADEMTQACAAAGVPSTPAEVVRVLEETEGWPIVANAVIRESAQSREPLGGGYERWRSGAGRHFGDYLSAEFARSGEPYRAAFRACLAADGTPEERERLTSLESRGLFVRFVDGAPRPYRVAAHFEREAAPAAGALLSESNALLVVGMFGRFEAEIGGRKIEWIRRREAQIFKYLLLKPDGTATRAELRETFWPDANMHLATQSIRTASSNIRKAIAAIVGYGNVDRYFASRGDMAVVLENAVIDIRRFTAHVTDGDADWADGRPAEALAHYRAAEALYGGELLSGEYPEDWYVPRAEMFKALFAGVLERLSELYAEAGSRRRADEYAERASELRPHLHSVEIRDRRGEIA